MFSRRLIQSAFAGFLSASVLLAVFAPAFAFAQDPGAALEATTKATGGTKPEVAGTGPGDITGGAGQAIAVVNDKILKPTWQSALFIALYNITQTLLDRVAYEAAVAIASAGEGQTPLAFTKEGLDAWTSYGTDVGSKVLSDLGGEALGQLSQGFVSIGGFNLCAPPDPLVRLNLQLGLAQAYKPPTPSCDLQTVGKNWGAIVANAQQTSNNPGRALAQQFAQTLRPGQNEFEASLQIYTATTEQVDLKKSLLMSEQANGNGFKSVTDFVTGQVKTPASVVLSTFNSRLSQADQNGDEVLKALVTNPDWILGLGVEAGSVFTNTLLSSVLSRVYKEGILPAVSDPSLQNFSNPEALSAGGRAQAEQAFAGSITPKPISIQDYNVLAEFSTCPTGGGVVRNLNNCVMDSAFATAVSRASTGTALTVQDAMSGPNPLLHPDWLLIGPDSKQDDQDPLCFNRAYCYGNLVKLRAARILPVGWELAAVKDSGKKQTLKQIVDGFNDCSAAGTSDDTHPWCHLIDPNWVLKYPETECKDIANTDLLLSPDIGVRTTACVDAPSCVQQDKDGNCTGGFGYCLREKNTWQFRGDECPEQFASCLSFTNTQTNAHSALLLDTVDYGPCNSSNAGCLWYRTNKYFDGKGNTDASDDAFSFLPTDFNAATGQNRPEPYVVASRDAEIQTATSVRPTHAYDTNGSAAGGSVSYARYAYQDREYFNKKVQTCSQNDNGCASLLRADGLTLNVVKNPSFEDATLDATKPDGWTLGSGVTYNAAAGSTADGSDNVTVNSGQNGTISQSGIFLTKDSFYTITLSGKNAVAATVNVQLVDATTGAPANVGGTSTRAIGSGTCSITGGDTVHLVTAAFPSTFDRQGCTFTATADVLATVSISAAAPLVVDAVQLERGENATAFAPEGYGTPDRTKFAANLKVPPAYLNCRGLPTDPKECASFAPVCSAQDVGCNLYAPNDGNPSIPAVTSALDTCPTECVGYAAFKQEDTKYETAKFPVDLIPTTAKACSANDAGCDAFTNLDAVAAGGEGIETYAGSNEPGSVGLRACVKPAADGSNNTSFYTWEGTDVQGFQLRTWNLLKSDTSAAPCSKWKMNDALTLVCQDAPAVFSATTQTDSIDPTCASHADTLNNLDCREFYDAGGAIHYRLFSATVTVSADCHPYRKTQTADDLPLQGAACTSAGGIATAAGTCSFAQADCLTSGGFFSTNGDCRYLGLASESQSCPAQSAGCRLYTGGAGNNVSTVFDETFEGGALTTFKSDQGGTVTISNDAVSAGGHSLRASSLSNGKGTAIAFTAGTPPTGPLVGKLVSGKTFILDFFAKGPGKIDVRFKDEGGTGATHTIQNGLVLDTGWHSYSLGPVDSSAFGATFNDHAVVAFDASATGGSTAFNLDNVQLRQVDSSLALIKGSWATPASCDTAPSGVPSPQFYLGCKAYTDKQGNKGSFFQFGHLCSEQVVGCSAFYDTRNSASPYGQSFNARCVGSVGTCSVAGKAVCTIQPGKTFCTFDSDFNHDGKDDFGTLSPLPANVQLGPEAQIVYNDAPIFLVDNGSNSCSAAVAGCQEVGLPTFSPDKSRVTAFTSAFLLNKPDDYGDILCKHDELFCQEFASTSNGNFYFKDPVNKLCEFRTDVTIANQKFSGWFRKGTTEPCAWTDSNGNGTFDPGTDFVLASGGTAFLAPKNGDVATATVPGFEGFAGVCEDKFNLCSAFLDPADTDGGRSPSGVIYTFVDNQKLTEADVATNDRCDGKVSQKAGCALFFDRKNPTPAFASLPSYIASVHADKLHGDQPFTPEDPISCGTASTGTDNLLGLNLCTQRCRYDVGTSHLKAADRFESAAHPTFDYEGACLDNTDCPSLPNVNGDAIQGQCVKVTASGEDPAAAFKNDTNRVIKVNPDRQCAEWLTCSNSSSHFNKDTQKWENTCQSVRLCTVPGPGGSATCGADQPNSSATVLNESTYESRDVSWYGQEYSGYSIPGQLPVDLYDQVNINPDHRCVNDSNGSSVNPIKGCSSNSDCDAGTHCDTANSVTPDIRVAHVAGSCSAAQRGTACQVGTCSVTGKSCTGDTDCTQTHDETCVFGYCQNILQLTNGCTTDQQCGAVNGNFPFCDQGVCVNEKTPNGSGCKLPTDCPTRAGETTHQCVPSANSLTGSCFNGQCLTSVKGTTLVTNGVSAAETVTCRAYPEAQSPFAWSKIVTAPTQNDISGLASNATPVPSATNPGFDKVNICTPVFNTATNRWETKDNCVCDYVKATYGDGTVTKFFSSDTNVSKTEGYCVGGQQAGFTCSTDTDCKPSGTDASSLISSAGICTHLQRTDQVFGQHGICIQRDTSIPLFGLATSNIPSDHACVLWLPVDQVLGATDLNEKNLSAGALPAQDAYYCSEASYFVDLYPTGSSDRNFQITQNDNKHLNLQNACAMNSVGTTCDVGEFGGNNQCAKNAWCPQGWAAVLGSCDADAADSTDANKDQGTLCKRQHMNGDNPAFAGTPYTWISGNSFAPADGCPYVCVPQHSYHIDHSVGNSCDTDLSGLTHTVNGLPQITDPVSGASSSPTQVYKVDGSSNRSFIEEMNYLSDCVRRGVPLGDDAETHVNTQWEFSTTATLPGGAVQHIGTLFSGKQGTDDNGKTTYTGGFEFHPKVNSDGSVDSSLGAFGVMHHIADVPIKRCGSTGMACTTDGDCEVHVRDPNDAVKTAEDLQQPCNAVCAAAVIGGFVVGGTSGLGIGAIPGAIGAGTACETICLVGNLFADHTCNVVQEVTTYSMKEYAACVELSKTSSNALSSSQDEYNKAWTNRLFEQYALPNGTSDLYSTVPVPSLGGSRFASFGFAGSHSPSGELTFDASQEPKPAGRALFTENYTINNNTATANGPSAQSSPLPVESCDLHTATGDSSHVGILGLVTGVACSTVDPSPDDSFGNNLGKAYEILTPTDEQNTYNGSVTLTSLDSQGSSSAGGNSSKVIDQLFAKIYERWHFVMDPATGVGSYQKVNAPVLDTSSQVPPDNNGDRDNKFPPPVLDTNNVQAPSRAPSVIPLGTCTADGCKELQGNRNAFSVNGKTSGDIEAGDGHLEATASFFTYANPNQMPIRSVTVDWGDPRQLPNDASQRGNSPIPDPSTKGNFFKNHRGLQNDGQTSFCDLTPTFWGVTPESCDNSFLSFDHTFSCSHEDVTSGRLAGRTCNVSPNGIVTNAPCVNEQGKCVYQPRVSVRDNWGWCTGTCTGGDDGTKECYQSTKSGGSATDECNLNLCPGPFCADSADPWIYYHGKIIVDPSN